MHTESQEPIDIVYCWCDGNEPQFKARKNHYLQLENRPMEQDDVGELRFWNNEELKYSLRSLEKYLPWINHVYIVTDRQVPAWLNLHNPRVSIIDHSEIMPSQSIPTFSASIIEHYLANIQGLTEKFLYANDDMFFNKPLQPSFFFTGDRPKIYLTYFEKFQKIDDENDFKVKYVQVSSWMQTNLNSWLLLFKNYGHHEFYVSVHSIDGYTKKLFKETLKRYEKVFAITDKHRFRFPENIARSIFGLDMVYSGQADLELVQMPGFVEKHIHHNPKFKLKAYCGSENKKSRDQIRRFKPAMFCINADIKGNLQDKQAMKVFYEELFPIPSSFERY